MGKLVSSFVIWSHDPGLKNTNMIPVNKSDKITEWCIENLSGSFGYTYLGGQKITDGWMIVMFEESDAMAFKLGWL